MAFVVSAVVNNYLNAAIGKLTAGKEMFLKENRSRDTLYEKLAKGIKFSQAKRDKFFEEEEQ